MGWGTRIDLVVVVSKLPLPTQQRAPHPFLHIHGVHRLPSLLGCAGVSVGVRDHALSGECGRATGKRELSVRNVSFRSANATAWSGSPEEGASPLPSHSRCSPASQPAGVCAYELVLESVFLVLGPTHVVQVLMANHIRPGSQHLTWECECECECEWECECECECGCEC